MKIVNSHDKKRWMPCSASVESQRVCTTPDEGRKKKKTSTIAVSLKPQIYQCDYTMLKTLFIQSWCQCEVWIEAKQSCWWRVFIFGWCQVQWLMAFGSPPHILHTQWPEKYAGSIDTPLPCSTYKKNTANFPRSHMFLDNANLYFY